MADSIWKPLDTDRKEIRLLLLRPNADPVAPVECVLETTSLLDYETAEPTSRDYEAISYVCGDPAQTTIGVINGHSFPILRSLSLALKHL